MTLKHLTLLLLIPLLAIACVAPNGEWTDADRRVLAEDLQDAIDAVGAIAGEASVSQYSEAVAKLVAALTAGELDTVTALSAIETIKQMEPQLRKLLSDAGADANEVESYVLLINVVLRRIQRTLTS